MKQRATEAQMADAERPSTPDSLRSPAWDGASAPAAVIVTTPQALAALVRDAVAEALDEARQNAGPLLLDRTGAAQALGVGTSSVDRFRKDGMPCVWVGDSPRFLVEECVAWLQEHRREPA